MSMSNGLSTKQQRRLKLHRNFDREEDPPWGPGRFVHIEDVLVFSFFNVFGEL